MYQKLNLSSPRLPLSSPLGTLAARESRNTIAVCSSSLLIGLFQHRKFSYRLLDPRLRGDGKGKAWRTWIYYSFLYLILNLSPAFADEALSPPQQNWSFQGMTGTFNRPSLQRGFQVYKEVCSACHGLKQIRFRELAALGFSAEEIKALAATYEITDGPNEEGEMFQRKGRPSDPILSPYKNENAARAANNGAFPPDQSLIIKARPDGANYVYALLTGFQNPPPGITLGPGMYYNQYFPGHQIAMAPPLTEGVVTFSDGTKATVDQMARDVTTFLSWAAEPEMETRKAMGVRVMIFISIFTLLMYFVMRRAWKRIL